MSWWVYLEDRTATPWCTYGISPDKFIPKYKGDAPCTEPCYHSVVVKRFAEGGKQIINGSTEAELNVTYNYSEILERVLGHTFSDALDNKKAGDVVELLGHAMMILDTDVSTDYWQATEGNVRVVISRLLMWAEQCPDAIFRVS